MCRGCGRRQRDTKTCRLPDVVPVDAGEWWLGTVVWSSVADERDSGQRRQKLVGQRGGDTAAAMSGVPVHAGERRSGQREVNNVGGTCLLEPAIGARAEHCVLADPRRPALHHVLGILAVRFDLQWLWIGAGG